MHIKRYNQATVDREYHGPFRRGKILPIAWVDGRNVMPKVGHPVPPKARSTDAKGNTK